MRPHTRRRGRRRRRHRRGLAGRVPRHPRPPPRVRRRRVLPARRPAVPRAASATRASRCTRTASAWPARSSSSSPARPPTSYRPARRVLRLGRPVGRRLRAVPRPPHVRRRSDGDAGAVARRDATRPSAILTGAVRRPGARPARRRGSAATTCGSSPSTTASSAATSASPGCWWATDLARTLADEPDGHRYLLPDVCLSQGRFLDGTTPPTCPARSRSSPPTAQALRARR